MPWWGWVLLLGAVGAGAFFLLRNRERVGAAVGLGSGDDATVMSPFARLLAGIGVEDDAATKASGVLHAVTAET